MKKIILIAAFIILVAGFAVLKTHQWQLAEDGLSSSLLSIPTGSQKIDGNPQDASAPASSTPAPYLEKTAPHDSETKIPAGTTVYKNTLYGIELSYPTAFGDVVTQLDEFIALPVSDKKSGECIDQGRFFHKGFSHNSNLDFGLISINYKKCSMPKHSIFDTKKVSVSGNQLTLNFWDADPTTVAIEKIIPLPNSNGIEGYIIKNSIGAARGEAAAVVPTPDKGLGPLIFRISNENTSNVMSYEQGAQLLEQLITQ